MKLKARQRLGKYRIDRKIADGGFAAVYKAYDTIEGISVALKIPHQRHFTQDAMSDFRREIRVTASLDHPHILPLKNASFIDDLLVIAYPLGESTLAERLRRRLSPKTALDFAEQMLDAVSYAHEHRIIHCDIKPENLIIFPSNHLRLTDFGIAKIAFRTRTLTGSGTGTIAYLAPEQAYGRPSLRSDVFAIGLVLYRMFTGFLPDWPHEWPPVEYDRLRRVANPQFIGLIRRAMEVNPNKRFKDATHLLRAFERIKPRALREPTRKKARNGQKAAQWKTLRIREFERHFGRTLGTRVGCARCGGPVTEPMRNCPWCGHARRRYTGDTSFPTRCKRCKRGLKRDWPFCPWCYGGRVQEPTVREYTDKRYTARCHNTQCSRGDLMPYMRYCPWCRTKVRRAWKIPHSRDKCARCGWGVTREFWAFCPWCAKKQTP